MLSKVRPRLVAPKNTQLNQYQIEFEFELYAWIGLQLQINMQKRIVFFVCPFNPNNLAFFSLLNQPFEANASTQLANDWDQINSFKKKR